MMKIKLPFLFNVVRVNGTRLLHSYSLQICTPLHSSE